MDSFTITLSNDATLTSLHNLPVSSSIPQYRPLIVLLHGGTYDAYYFDVDSRYGASFMSNALGLPCIAPNRPGYRDSTPLSSTTGDFNYAQDYGICLHKYILPSLWSKFGQTHGCNCIVLHCHSIATTGAIVAAGLHANEPAAAYPLASIICSGFGSQESWMPDDPLKSGSDRPVLYLPHVEKDAMLLQWGLADPTIYQHSERLNHTTSIEEFKSINEFWNLKWRELAAKVNVPVMWAIAGRDTVWKTSEEHVHEITSAFVNSERVDGSIVKGAPHNMELSYWAHGWYARCFGFALECAASFSLTEKMVATE